MAVKSTPKKVEKVESLNKDELVTEVAGRIGLPKTQTKMAVEEIFNVISEHLAKGGKFQYIGFGAFGVKTRSARVGINPSTKQKISIPEKKIPYFSPGKKLSEKIQ